MARDPHAGLSAREREILNILYRLGSASAEEVLSEMERPPSNATVRSTLRVLEEKGRVSHSRDGQRYVFEPVAPGEAVRGPALGHLVRTFFQGSRADAVAALLDAEGASLTPEDRTRIVELIQRLEEGDT